jgi:aspartate kinase
VVRSSFTDNEGTNVKEEAVMEQGIVVRGIAYDKNVARISILGVPEKPGQLAKVFSELAKNHLDVDIIVQSGVTGGSADFSFTTSLTDRERALEIIEQTRGVIGYREVTFEENLVKVSIVGAGMVSTPGVAATMFQVISDLGVSISLVSTSEIKVSCVIDQTHLADVIRALHSVYGLDSTEQAFVGGPSERR